jgi:hypothetical protein
MIKRYTPYENKRRASKMIDLHQKNILLRKKFILAQQQLLKQCNVLLPDNDATIKLLKQENASLHQQILDNENYVYATYTESSEKYTIIKSLKQDIVLLQQKVICAPQCDLEKDIYIESINLKLAEHKKTIWLLQSRENSVREWENNLHARALNIDYDAAKHVEAVINLELREKELGKSVYIESIHLKLAEQEKTILQLQNNLLMLPLKQNELQEWEDDLRLLSKEMAYNADKQYLVQQLQQLRKQIRKYENVVQELNTKLLKKTDI